MARKSGFAYNGIQYVSWWHDEYAQSANASASIDALAATGADSAGILVTWYWDPQSDRIRPDPLRTPTDDALQYAMDELHGRGLQVMLKPHIDGPDGTWRGNMKPSPVNGSVWFQEYKAFITRYAALAQSNAAELLAIGTELKQISSNAPFWTDVIQSVRAIYAGMLTYAANAVSADDEFTAVPFWDQLDLIGLNAYFPLTNMDDPPVPALVAAWSRNLNNLDAIAAVKSVHTAYNKPVVLTEIGYRSARGCNRQPFLWQSQGDYDPQEQADCYEAFFRVWSQQASWMQGAFWWDWPVAPPSQTAAEYTPQGKAANDTLKEWFGGD